MSTITHAEVIAELEGEQEERPFSRFHAFNPIELEAMKIGIENQMASFADLKKSDLGYFIHLDELTMNANLLKEIDAAIDAWTLEF